MIVLQTVNKLMITITITKPAPLPRPSLILQWKQIGISGLDVSHRQFTITPEEKYQDQ